LTGKGFHGRSVGVNIVLFHPGEDLSFLPAGDPRAVHILTVLGMRQGECFDMGIVGGTRGKGKIVSASPSGICIAWEPGPLPRPLSPLTLLVGMVRPIMGRRIVRDMSTIGVSRLLFFPADRGEGSYRDASFYRNEEFLVPLVEGASQGFTTLVPEVRVVSCLEEGLAGAGAGDAGGAGIALTETVMRDGAAADEADSTKAAAGYALDNYEASLPLGSPGPVRLPAVLAVGPERGWSPRERDLFRDKGFTLSHLGPRVLRTETACIAGAFLLLAAAGRL